MGLSIKIGLGFLIALVVFIVIVIFGNTIALPPRHIKFAATLPPNALSAPEIISAESSRYFNPAPERASALLGETMRSYGDKASPATGNNENVTKFLASFIGKDLLDRNPEGPRDEKFFIEDPQELAEKVFVESARKFDPLSFQPTVTRDQITISNVQPTARYQEERRRILAALDAPVPPVNENTWREQVDALADQYTKTIAELRALPVPEHLAEDHLKIVRAAMGKQVILIALQDYETDPVRALLAMTLWQN